MLSSLAHKLSTRPEFSSSLVSILRLVIEEVHRGSGYVRSAACHALAVFGALTRTEHDDPSLSELWSNAANAVLQCMSDAHLSVKVEAAVCLERLLDRQEVRNVAQLHIQAILQSLIFLLASI